MMRCDEVSRLLADGMAGALPRRRRQAVEAHLAGCAACRAEQDALARAVGLLSQAARPGVPAGLWAGVEARLAAAPAPRRRWALRLAWAGAVPAALLATALWLRLPGAPDPLVAGHYRVRASASLADSAVGDILGALAEQSR